MKDQPKVFTVIEVQGRGHVLTSDSKNDVANYRGTGKALCGVLNKGETLEEWMERTMNQ